ncbi:hypothetical protein HNO88_000403 [Novosphingobium chloroacetimidivorans]|uniref:Uncharacterized protein n=1 Tax=Novosphingobium chloroacetimidivorans TaxID=1428314 RepID=A0A7W7NUD8_9SPHN|nr:hypothetical protein [Novosphingobium chloroacetimidivorans]MBB4857106.1 hypothetical protein [Novosphingobium chloroacetimidivorans]
MAERPAPWVFLAVALAIALVAFAIGQAVPGAGMVFVIAATTGWVVAAQRLWSKNARG